MSKTKSTDKIVSDGQDQQVDQCFIITPIGESNSDVYNKAMGLIEAVIKPVLEEFNFKPVAANHMSAPGSINRQLLKAILEDKLVIANLTGLNPNVMYELAVRHAARLPVVIMTEKGTRLPFDITDQRTIFYEDSLAGLGAAKKQLRDMVEVAILEKNPDNPIYQAKEQASIFKELSPTDPMKVILERLSQIEDNMNGIKIQNNRNDEKEHEISLGRRVLEVSFSAEFYIKPQKIRLDYLINLVKKCPGIRLRSIKFNEPTAEIIYFADSNLANRNFLRFLNDDENLLATEQTKII